MTAALMHNIARQKLSYNDKVGQQCWPMCRGLYQVNNYVSVTFGRLAVSDSELGVDVIDFDECYCYLFTVLYCSLVLHAGPF